MTHSASQSDFAFFVYSKSPTTFPSYFPSTYPSNLPSIPPTFTASPTTAPEQIIEEICLVHNHRYSFSISDLFGDGMCCAEGKGSYAIRVNDNIIAEGGDSGKSEYFWFRLQDCMSDSDCDDGDISTISICKKEAAVCLHTPRPCIDYGHMVSIDV